MTLTLLFQNDTLWIEKKIIFLLKTAKKKGYCATNRGVLFRINKKVAAVDVIWHWFFSF